MRPRPSSFRIVGGHLHSLGGPDAAPVRPVAPPPVIAPATLTAASASILGATNARPEDVTRAKIRIGRLGFTNPEKAGPGKISVRAVGTQGTTSPQEMPLGGLRLEAEFQTSNGLPVTVPLTTDATGSAVFDPDVQAGSEVKYTIRALAADGTLVATDSGRIRAGEQPTVKLAISRTNNLKAEFASGVKWNETVTAALAGLDDGVAGARKIADLIAHGAEIHADRIKHRPKPGPSSPGNKSAIAKLADHLAKQ